MSKMSELALQRSDGMESLDLCRIAEMLRGEVDGQWVRCPSPGQGPEDRSCQIRINPVRPSDFFIYDCVGSKRAAYAATRQKLKLISPPSVDHSNLARRIWCESIPADGTDVESYLRSRAITIKPPSCLRFHPALFHAPSQTRWPCMVAERLDQSGHGAAIHRTYLARSGLGKAPIDPVRMDLGRSQGTAIWLTPPSRHLVVGEGIETTLSVIQAAGLPGCAAGSASALRTLRLPASVSSVTILADGDDAGEGAAIAAATQWIAEGREVRIARAPAGKDFNDLLVEERSGEQDR